MASGLSFTLGNYLESPRRMAGKWKRWGVVNWARHGLTSLTSGGVNPGDSVRSN